MALMQAADRGRLTWLKRLQQLVDVVHSGAAVVGVQQVHGRVPKIVAAHVLRHAEVGRCSHFDHRRGQGRS
jgi:hypothetical protein